MEVDSKSSDEDTEDESTFIKSDLKENELVDDYEINSDTIIVENVE